MDQSIDSDTIECTQQLIPTDVNDDSTPDVVSLLFIIYIPITFWNLQVGTYWNFVQPKLVNIFI